MIVEPNVEEYAEAHSTPDGELFERLAAETREKTTSPQMMVGLLEGRFLGVLVRTLHARRVLELGTYSGYSSISMAAGLPEGGHIDTCEFDETHAEVARRYVGQSPYADRITVHVGPALETIKQLEGDFDFVFVDADKENYLNYYEATLPLLGVGGLMVVDNTLWSGRIVDAGDDDKTTNAIRVLNDRVLADARVENVLLTVRDGMNLVWRA